MLAPSFSRSSVAIVSLALAFAAAESSAQVMVVETLRPIVPLPAAPAYVANYTPAGNYAAVTAFSPPVYAVPAPLVATMPTSSVAVTSYYAPAAAAMPVTSFYAPPAVVESVATTAFYAPAAVAAPVTTFYAPAAVAMPLYRRGPFGGLRPVRTAWYYPY